MALPARDPLAANYSLDIEMAVIGIILMDFEEAWPQVRHLEPEIFAEPRHQTIFRAIQAVAADTTLVDTTLVAGQLGSTSQLEAVGGALYLLDCSALEYTRARLGDYLQALNRAFSLRLIIALAGEVSNMARTGTARPEDLALKLQATASTIQKNSGVGQPTHSAEVMKKTVQLIERRKRTGEGGIVTGFDWLDGFLQTLEPGQFILLGGRPSMGKTSLAMSIAENVGGAGHPVGVLSLEMPREDLGIRLIAKHARISTSELRGRKDIGADGWNKVHEAAARLSEVPLHFGSDCDSGGATLDRIIAQMHKLTRDRGCELLVLDYLGLISPGPKMPASQTQWISFVSQQLKLTARELKVPLLCLSQLSRAPETRGDFRPILSDLRDSGSLEQDADVVLFAFRPWYYVSNSNGEEQQVAGGNERKSKRGGLATVKIDGRCVTTENLCEVIVAKNRNGGTGSCWLSWRAEYCSFGNLGRDDPPQTGEEDGGKL